MCFIGEEIQKIRLQAERWCRLTKQCCRPAKTGYYLSRPNHLVLPELPRREKGIIFSNGPEIPVG